MKQNKNVLISGASFAGLTTAYWMNQLGYNVTVVEIGESLKMGGTPVDIKDRTVDIVREMGILEQIKANRLHLQKWEFKNADDLTEHAIQLMQPGEEIPDDEFEIERDTLLNMLYNLIKNDVTFVFNNSITSLSEKEDRMEVVFRDGSHHSFELVFGCDGIHSAVRRLWFGDETNYVRFLGQYFSIAIVNKSLIDESTLQLYSEPNKGIMLNAYNNKTDIVFTFRPEKEIPYDFRNQEQQKKIVLDQFKGMSWRTTELQEELIHSKTFYFDKFCQVKMNSWTKGRVALVGDSAYCASPAAGMGGSLAIIGATSLSEALKKHPGNFKAAFALYNNDLRPFIEQVQAEAIEMLDKLLPRTEEEIQMRFQNGLL